MHIYIDQGKFFDTSITKIKSRNNEKIFFFKLSLGITDMEYISPKLHRILIQAILNLQKLCWHSLPKVVSTYAPNRDHISPTAVAIFYKWYLLSKHHLHIIYKRGNIQTHLANKNTKSKDSTIYLALAVFVQNSALSHQVLPFHLAVIFQVNPLKVEKTS